MGKDGFMMHILLRWLLSAVSFIIVAKILPGFRLKDFQKALAAAAVYGILQFLLFKFLVIISFIPVILTFGLFVFVINAFLLYLTDVLVEGFEIDGAVTTLIGAVLLSLLNNLFYFLLRI
jgi:putative membrane protein